MMQLSLEFVAITMNHLFKKHFLSFPLVFGDIQPSNLIWPLPQNSVHYFSENMCTKLCFYNCK